MSIVPFNRFAAIALSLTALLLGMPASVNAKSEAAKVPQVVSVTVDLEAKLISIIGEDFDLTTYPELTLGGIPLVTEMADPGFIQASYAGPLPAGDHRLVISQNGGKILTTYDLTIDAPRLSRDSFYVRVRTSPPVTGGFLGTSVLCDPGDIATGGGISCPATGSCGSGSNGPFISVNGPRLDEDGKPVGWVAGMSNIQVAGAFTRDIYVICADVSDQ